MVSSMITANPNQADILKAVANMHDADTLKVLPGTCIWDTTNGGTPPNITVANPSIYGEGVTIRPVMRPFYDSTDLQRAVAMNTLGLAGPGYENLNSADKTRVDNWLKTNKPNISALQTAANAIIASLSPIRDSRWLDANAVQLEPITYNGKSYSLHIKWTSGVNKGLFTFEQPNGAKGPWGAFIKGFTFENATGGSANGAGVRAQGSDLWVEECTFRDCQDGWLANSLPSTPDPNGVWYGENPPNLYSFYGFVVGKNNTYDGCGAGGLAHGRYAGHKPYSIEFGSKAVRAAAGHYAKFVSGMQLAISCDFEDDGTDLGVVQAFDADAGYAGIFNSKITKASAGTGNHSEIIQMRNGRTPLPAFMENALVVRGNVITAGIPVNWFIRALNQTFYSADDVTPTWPGVPTPIRAVAKDNVFRSAIPLKTPFSGVTDGGNNQFLSLTAPVPDPSVPVPNYDFNRSTFRQYVSDLLSAQDAGIKPGMLSAINALPTYPAGVTVTYPEAQEDPVALAQALADLADAQAKLADAQAQLADAQTAETAKDAEIARLNGIITAAQGDLAKAAAPAA